MYYKTIQKPIINYKQFLQKMTYKPTFGKTYLCDLYLDAPFVNAKRNQTGVILPIYFSHHSSTHQIN